MRTDSMTLIEANAFSRRIVTVAAELNQLRVVLQQLELTEEVYSYTDALDDILRKTRRMNNLAYKDKL